MVHLAKEKFMYAVVTGGSKGIGKAIAEIFAKNGYNLVLTGRNEVDLYKTVEYFQTKYTTIEVVAKPFDLSMNAKAFAQWVLLKGIVPDVLVNNAGAFKPGNIADMPEGLLEEQMATNLYSAFYVTQTFLPKMIAAGQGHIFNVCSVAGQKAYPMGGAYSISKFALDGFSKNLRVELSQQNIKVTTVYPGPVLTASWGDFDNSDNRIMLSYDIAQMVYAATLMSSGACVEEIVLRPQKGDL